jgi:hypothetical protein
MQRERWVRPGLVGTLEPDWPRLPRAPRVHVRRCLPGRGSHSARLLEHSCWSGAEAVARSPVERGPARRGCRGPSRRIAFPASSRQGGWPIGIMAQVSPDPKRCFFDVCYQVRNQARFATWLASSLPGNSIHGPVFGDKGSGAPSARTGIGQSASSPRRVPRGKSQT